MAFLPGGNHVIDRYNRRSESFSLYTYKTRLYTLALLLTFVASIACKDSNPSNDGDGDNGNGDNCLSSPKTEQLDTDGDKIIDICDVDDDGDGYIEIFDETMLNNMRYGLAGEEL